MRQFHVLVIAAAVAVFSLAPESAYAGGSWGGSSGGGYASGGSGGSSGGGLFSRLRAKIAAHHSGGSYGGSSGGYRAASVSYGSSGGSSGGRVGPIKRLFAKIRAHHRSRGSGGGASSGGGYTYTSAYRGGGSTGGGYRSYAAPVSYAAPAVSHSTPVQSYSSPVVSSSYGSYSAPMVQSISLGAEAGYESSSIQSSYDVHSASMGETVIGGSYDSGIYNSGIITDSVPLESGSTIVDPVPASPVGPAAEGEGASVDESADSASSEPYTAAKPALEDDAAMITVSVPNNAVVTVNDHSTMSEGNVRQFMSKGLREGFVYTYVVNVEYDLAGVTKTESKEVKLRAGQTESIAFEAPAVDANQTPAELDVPSSQDVVTVVRLQVPSDAQVTLAGNPTGGSGSVRTFRTTQLKVGEQWSDYTVRVTANVNGQSVTKERTVNVIAGGTTELVFDFDANVIASR